jgi:hypothetical protein
MLVLEISQLAKRFSRLDYLYSHDNICGGDAGEAQPNRSSRWLII